MTARGVSISLVLASAALPCVHMKTEAGERGRRDGILVLTALASLGVVAIPVLHYVTGYIINEEELKNRYKMFSKVNLSRGSKVICRICEPEVAL